MKGKTMRLIDADKLSEHKFPLTPLRYHVGWNDAICAVIENAPTIEAEPVKHGRWYTPWEPLDLGDVYARCSVCGKNFREEYQNSEGFDRETAHYCPNCGAKMDLEG